MKIRPTNNLRPSFIFGFIMNNLNLNLGEEASHHFMFISNIFILSIICLLSFINIIGYILSIYLIDKYNIENKYPKLQWIIKYFKNTSISFIVFETIMCLSFLTVIVISCLFELGIIIKS